MVYPTFFELDAVAGELGIPFAGGGAAGDDEGNGKVDIAVHCPPNGGGYILQSNSNYATTLAHHGTSTTCRS